MLTRHHPPSSDPHPGKLPAVQASSDHILYVPHEGWGLNNRVIITEAGGVLFYEKMYNDGGFQADRDAIGGG